MEVSIAKIKVDNGTEYRIMCPEIRNCKCRYKDPFYCCSLKYLKCMEYQVLNNAKAIAKFQAIDKSRNKGDTK